MALLRDAFPSYSVFVLAPSPGSSDLLHAFPDLFFFFCMSSKDRGAWEQGHLITRALPNGIGGGGGMSAPSLGAAGGGGGGATGAAVSRPAALLLSAAMAMLLRSP